MVWRGAATRILALQPPGHQWSGADAVVTSPIQPCPLLLTATLLG
jgi:hypothetical protein